MWIIAFFSKVGFFVSYVATFFLVLEVVRLVCTDANKREAERLLDAYTRGRETEKKPGISHTLSVDELDNESEAFPALNEPVQTPQRRTRKTVLHRTPTSEKPPVSEEKEKRKRSQTPTRRLRKRSDTLNSTSTSDSRHSSRSKSSSTASSRTTSESRRSSRSHRDSSPESVTSKESERRRASPSMRRSRDASLSLHRLLRQKV
ncbi:hypothetical protein N0V91_000620 [Didymella pomorum]|jgi:hypothetical protein|uniref:Uncharacterized protein n=1 Tax=Didymella pomorum TaxID=749634 RepID=A0A9W8ZQ10_9PLEO|nr:hypothetical protein N0V91_000620 [Didymella pomorum]